MKNKNGFISMTLVYTFLILFLFVMLAILKTYSRNNKVLTTFSERINNDLRTSNEQKSKLYYRILIDNLSYPDSVSSTNVSRSNGIDFSKPASSTNGEGYIIQLIILKLLMVIKYIILEVMLIIIMLYMQDFVLE